ncbi:MAG: NAD(P)-dependent oxidoreductase [Clostridia bacterium]
MTADNKNKVFPIFINLQNKNILVVGFGNVAKRRIRTLLKFDCNIKVVAPEEIEEEFLGKIEYIKGEFKEKYLDDCFMVLGATNDRNINQQIYEKCKEKRIFVNICDKKDDCDFFFPAIFEDEEIIGALVSKHGDRHSLVKETAKKIRGVL